MTIHSIVIVIYSLSSGDLFFYLFHLPNLFHTRKVILTPLIKESLLQSNLRSQYEPTSFSYLCFLCIMFSNYYLKNRLDIFDLYIIF